MKNCSQLLNFLLFADDTNIFAFNRDVDLLFKTVNEELHSLSNWFRANKLSLNIKKTNFMLFSKCHYNLTNCDLKIDDVTIERVCTSKFLGVLIDDKLHWKPHICYVAAKVSRNIGVIKRIRFKINFKTALLLYDTMVQSHFSYCRLLLHGVILLRVMLPF